MEEVLDTVEVGRPRREPEEPQFLDAEQAEALIEQAREQGVELPERRSDAACDNSSQAARRWY